MRDILKKKFKNTLMNGGIVACGRMFVGHFGEISEAIFVIW